jgi:hypothetical protein
LVLAIGRHLRELVDGIIGTLLGHAVELVGLAGPVSGGIVAVHRSVDRGAARLVQHVQQARQLIVGDHKLSFYFEEEGEP